MLGAAPSYWITWFPGALLAVFGVAALVWKAIVRLVNGTRTLKQVQDVLPTLMAEFSPDHGHSLKDRVEALHDKQDAHIRILTTHIGQDERAFKRQERFNGRVEASLERIEDHLTR